MQGEPLRPSRTVLQQLRLGGLEPGECWEALLGVPVLVGAGVP